MLRQSKWDGRHAHISDPPRSVPFAVRLRILTGGSINLIGWLFFGFGMIFVWIFGGAVLLNDWVYLSGDSAQTEATITHIAPTKTKINNRRLYKYSYEYEVDGIGYTGSSDAYFGKYAIDATVPLDYSLSQPSRSRISDLNTYGWSVVISAVFPLIGLLLILSGIFKSLKGVRLLRYGVKTNGELISQVPTSTRINDRVVYKFTFKFTARDGRRYETTVRTHQTEFFAGEYVGGKPTGGKSSGGIVEPLFYNPNNPNDAILLDAIPGRPRFNEYGVIDGMEGSLIASLLIPGLMILAHSTVFLFVVDIL